MIAENIDEVRRNMAAACSMRREGLSDTVTLVAVTKNHDVAAMREAIDYAEGNIIDIGENRIQEAMSKRDILDRKVIWHLIGHLQTNKVKQAVHLFDLIHSVDSVKLAMALNDAASAIGKVQDVLLQVNLAREESKFGLYEEELNESLSKVDSFANIRIKGLMLIAPFFDDPEQCRPLFKRMYSIYGEVKKMEFSRANIEFLSMGMTNDYGIAIEEGSNIVRVGTGIFGKRVI